MDIKSLGVIVLVILVLGLGYVVNQHSLKREPVYGGLLSVVFNFMTGLFFVAIMPTVCMSLFILRPETVDVAGMTFNPVLVTVILFALLSIFSSILFAIVEKTPLEQALAEQARHEDEGWTETDARTSGL